MSNEDEMDLSQLPDWFQELPMSLDAFLCLDRKVWVDKPNDVKMATVLAQPDAYPFLLCAKIAHSPTLFAFSAKRSEDRAVRKYQEQVQTLKDEGNTSYWAVDARNEVVYDDPTALYSELESEFDLVTY